MDGLDRLLTMFEDRFGRKTTTVVVVVFVACFLIIAIAQAWANGIKPLSEDVRSLFAGYVDWLQVAVSTLVSLGLSLVGTLLFYVLSRVTMRKIRSEASAIQGEIESDSAAMRDKAAAIEARMDESYRELERLHGDAVGALERATAMRDAALKLIQEPVIADVIEAAPANSPLQHLLHDLLRVSQTEGPPSEAAE
jgi:hypothetical protein